MYEDCKINGPYRGAEGRLRIHITYPDGKVRTKSYSKYLMECKLERELGIDETVDHIDKNIYNNDLSNLRVIGRAGHSALDTKRLVHQEVYCKLCGITLILDGRRLADLIYNLKRGRVGPFCSKSCAGKYGNQIKNGEEKQEPVRIEPTYITLKKILDGTEKV